MALNLGGDRIAQKYPPRARYGLQTSSVLCLRPVVIRRIPAVKETENAKTRRIRQHDSIVDLALPANSLVPQRKEKCLVPDNGSTEAYRVLVIIRPVRLDRLPRCRIDLSIVRPCVRIERAVSEIPNRSTGIPVGSGASRNLDLTVTSPHLRVHGRQDQTYLTNQVRIDRRRREKTVIETAVAHADTVSNCVEGVCCRTCKRVEGLASRCFP